tara:strand:+ start:1095 stop:1955 length:861 start_codon:yes stop_codon:yes gene_type:complete
MANLKDIRDRIKSVKSIQQVTKAMKLVAAAKMRKAQERMEQARPYEENLANMISSLISNIDESSSTLFQSKKSKRELLIVVTSDRGMAGAFNANIIRKAEERVVLLGKENIDLFFIGKKGSDHFKSRGYDIVDSYNDFWNDLNFADAMKFSSDVINKFLESDIGKVNVVYNWFRNVAVQEARLENFLPIAFENKSNFSNDDQLFEPSKKMIVKSLIPRHLNFQIWKYLLESYASEQAARMVAMDNATENGKDLIKDLTLDFNKARQAAITKEMLEIVGGAEALATN